MELENPSLPDITSPPTAAAAAPPAATPVEGSLRESFPLVFDDLARPEAASIGPNAKAIVQLGALLRELSELHAAKKRDIKAILELATRFEAWDKGIAAAMTLPALQIAHLQAQKLRALKTIYLTAADELRILTFKE